MDTTQARREGGGGGKGRGRSEGSGGSVALRGAAGGVVLQYTRLFERKVCHRGRYCSSS